MIYAQLLGGVGNISFIVATAYAVALDNHDEAVFSNTLSSITRRKNEKWWFQTFFRKIKCGQPANKLIQWKEKNFNYSPIRYLHPGLRLHGYYQSPKYFNHRRQEILELFKDYKNDINNSLELKLDLLPGKKIALHIRRTDYIKLQHTHTVLPMSYYQNAVKTIKEKLGKEYEQYIYLVFSDDIEWCKKQQFLKQLPDVHFISDSDPLTKGPVEIFQLYLMSMCEHNIIANSSFSWWGAYLNENPNQIVIAPKKWFNQGGPKNWNDIYCDNWIVCSL
jgi:hypothetical protein